MAKLNTLLQDIFDSISFYLNAKDFSKCYETGDLCLHFLIRPKSMVASLTEKSVLYRFCSLATLELKMDKRMPKSPIQYPPNLTSLTLTNASLEWVNQIFPKNLKTLNLSLETIFRDPETDPFGVLWQNLPPNLTSLRAPCFTFGKDIISQLPQSIERLDVFLQSCLTLRQMLIQGLAVLPKSVTYLEIGPLTRLPSLFNIAEILNALPKNLKYTNLLAHHLTNIDENCVRSLPSFLLHISCSNVEMFKLAHLPPLLEKFYYSATDDFCDTSFVALPSSLTRVHVNRPTEAFFKSLQESSLPHVHFMKIFNFRTIQLESLPCSVAVLDLGVQWHLNHRALLNDSIDHKLWSRLKNLTELSIVDLEISHEMMFNLPLSLKTFCWAEDGESVHDNNALFSYVQLTRSAPFLRSLECLIIIGNCGIFTDYNVRHLSPTLKKLVLHDRSLHQYNFSLTNYGWDALPATLEHLEITAPREYFANYDKHLEWMPPKHLKRLARVKFRRIEDYEIFNLTWERATSQWTRHDYNLVD
jgi:hypothetical protein